MGAEEAAMLPRPRFRWLVRRRFAILALIIVIGLVTWNQVAIFDVIPRVFPPPGASSEITPSLAAGDWSQVGRDPQSSRFTPYKAPVPARIKWKFPTAERILASPSVVDGVAYLTTNDGRLVALGAESGVVIWGHVTGERSSSSPAVTGDLVISATRPGRVIAVDRNSGQLVWEVNLRSPIYASPVVGDGTVYIGSGASKLFAIDVLTGEIRWEARTRDWVVAPAAYSGSTVVVASQGKVVDIFDTKNGRRRLKYNTGKVRFGGAPSIQGDLAYFSSDGGVVWAIDRNAQTFPTERFLFHAKINLYVWQLISSRPVQLGSIWSKRIGSDINLALAATEQAVFGAKSDGSVFARGALRGEDLWSTKLGSDIEVAPIVAADQVLVGTVDGDVIAVDTQSGVIQWDFPIGAAITSSPIVAGDSIYVGAADGHLYAIGAH